MPKSRTVSFSGMPTRGVRIIGQPRSFADASNQEDILDVVESRIRYQVGVAMNYCLYFHLLNMSVK
jgi:hypothetical protein